MAEVIIENANVLDVETGSVAADAYLVVENGKIKEVGTGTVSLVSSAHRIDAKGLLAVPGFIDSHVHATAFASTFSELSQSSPAYAALQSAKILEGMLRKGFTTVRDVGGADFGLAKALEEGLVDGPRLFFGGKALSQTGGHSDMRGPGMDAMDRSYLTPSLGLVVDGVSEVRRAVREEIRRGAHHIKFMGGGGAASPTDRLDSDQFSEEEIAAIVEEANMANIYAVVHAYTTRQIERSVRLGVRSIEHCNFIDQAVARQMRDSDAYMVPTLVAYHTASRHGIEAGMSQGTVDKINILLGVGVGSIEIARREGVPMAYGTDLVGNYMHRFQLEEFAIRSEVVPPLELLQSATVVGARLLRREDTLGQLKAGFEADVLLLRRNPLDDISSLQDPERNLALILRGGKVFKNEV